ncbi:hypothetical protein [Cupriavidus sp. BIC8F]|uniref:hypothetical protein n=1 Tax=Cupriavidus sp. BIC8F TaxID=3079014 RepID=UPI0029170AF3|nr:hypothetical protein [Cupriavidus sp. BIC8F]
MTDIQHYEDRVYTTVDVCKILELGIDPERLAAWPNVTLPEYVIAVARARAAEADPLELEELKEAQRPRRVLRTEWGILVIDLEESEPGDLSGWVLQVEAFLEEDPYLELPHLRREPGETVGIYLSDLVNGAIENGPGGSLLEGLSEMGLEWTDNDRTGQVFALIGSSEPSQPLNLPRLGGLLPHWLGKSDVGRVASTVRMMEALRTVTEDCALPITRAVLH